MGQLSKGLGQTLPLACGDWASTKAAYRFLDNSRVSEREILAGHFQATQARFAAIDGPILVLHDTTEFSFTRSDTQAIGQTRKAPTGSRASDGRWRLHTVCGILERHGIQIARSTLCDWMAQCALVLHPLYDLMAQDVLLSKVIHTDDTPVDVLDKLCKATRTGRFWAYLGDQHHPNTVFTYTPSRSRNGPMEFLKGWGQEQRVYLQADAFGGYDGIYRGEAGGQVMEVACWAHARRKFYDARHADAAISTAALAYIRLLYDVEDLARQSAQENQTDLAAERYRLRQERSVPLLEQFKSWLESQQAQAGGPVLPKSPVGQAIQYALNQWDALCVYTTDGDLSIDNNASENALRRVALGRKNWLFCGSDNGGNTAAVLFSLIATCQRHKVDPFVYLRDVLTRIAAHPMNRLAELLPERWNEKQLAQTVATPA